MKVFLSWSGERSKALAKLLERVIPRVIPRARTFMSESDLGPGDQWAHGLFQHLSSSAVCIACLTRSSLSSPWIHFEAGAVTHMTARRAGGRVFALLLDLKETDLSGPLRQFTAVPFDEKGLRKMMEALERRGTRALAEAETGGRA